MRAAVGDRPREVTAVGIFPTPKAEFGSRDPNAAQRSLEETTSFSPEFGSRFSEPSPRGMTRTSGQERYLNSYRLYLRAGKSIIARQDFEAESDAAGLWIAAALCEASADTCKTFELWDGARRVDRPGLRVDGSDIRVETQARLIETEEILLQSNWSVASSRQLLSRLDELRKLHLSTSR